MHPLDLEAGKIDDAPVVFGAFHDQGTRIEEIIGEMGDDRVPSPDAVREPDGSLILRGSVSLEKVQELFGVEWNVTGEESATTIAGLLNHIAGRVPLGGDHIDYGGLRFEILEANQRKVLRLRARKISTSVSAG